MRNPRCCGTDVCGDEIFEGDYILEHNGELILECNAMDYLIEHLGAVQKVAGKEEDSCCNKSPNTLKTT